MELIWLMLFVILITIEMLTLNLFTIWFGIGALAAFIASYITTNIMTQSLVFAIVAVLSLVSTRPFVKKMLKGRERVRTNLDSVIGETGIVEVEIKPNTMGRVTVLGKDWAAKSEENIKVGSKVEILAIEGVKLIVRKKEGK